MGFNRICFHGAIDSQQELPTKSTVETTAMARKIINTLGPAGGYILAPTHMLQLDVPLENVLALYQVNRKVEKSE